MKEELTMKFEKKALTIFMHMFFCAFFGLGFSIGIGIIGKGDLIPGLAISILSFKFLIDSFIRLIKQ